MYDFKLKNLLAIVLPCILLSHLLMVAYFPSQISQTTGLILIFLVIYFQTLRTEKYFLFIIIIFIFSHFQLAANQGGAFNIIAFFSILLSFNKINRNQDFHKTPTFLIVLSVVFFLINIFCWITNEESQMQFKILGFITLLGYLMMFLFVSKLNITKERLIIFLTTSIVLLIWMAIVSLNMRLGLLVTKSLYFGFVEAYLKSSRVGSVFNYSDSGEYAMFSLIIILPFYLSRLSKYDFSIKNKYYYFAGISILILIIVTQMRSSLMLSLIFILMFYLYTIFQKRNQNFSQAKFYIILLFFSVIFVSLASFLQFESFVDRFNELNFSAFSDPEAITSGSDINRGVTTLIGLQRIEERPWILGFGWESLEGNLQAWYGQYFREYGDPHSLYFSIVPVFGWFGSGVFLLFFIYTLFRVVNALFFYKGINSYLTVALISFAFMILFFLINQFKQTILSNSTYFMIIGIWLGLANAVVTTLNNNQKSKI